DFGCRAGTGPLLVELWCAGVLAGELDKPGNQCPVIGVGAGAVVDDVLPPAVEHVPMRVGEPIRGVALQIPRAGIEPPDTGVFIPDGTVGGFDLRPMEDP